MPCLRGIEVSLTAQLDGVQILEYPHPEGASVKLLDDQANGSHRFPPTRDAKCGSPGYQKTKPTVSVYIPSAPGSPFSVNYSINSIPPSPCKYVYFKLYINGRHMASWGIEPAVQRSGKIVKSLWAPAGRYSEHVGLEGRNFVFLSGQENKSAAEDGGLIEIQTFRAKDRRPRAPRLEEFQEFRNYRIAAPSIGLVDEPQDAFYYQWHLIDPKDSPFVVFRLHYRTWKSLRHLNLIPSVYSDRSLLGSLSFTSLDVEAASEANSQPPAQYSAYHLISVDESVFEGDASSKVASVLQPIGYFLKTPPERFRPSSRASSIPQPSKAARDTFRESYREYPIKEHYNPFCLFVCLYVWSPETSVLHQT